MSDLLGGRYDLVRELGAGSMGVVWLAHDTVLDRPVALKEMRIPDSLVEADAQRRFLTEAQAAARLNHPSIVTVHDVFSDGPRILMSLEVLDGPTLADIIATGGAGGEVRAVMTSVAGALAIAHAQGVIHRDLKPENIFALPSGRVVVCDFGLARIGVGRGTHVGTVMGTPGYMAPEQVQGQDVGAAADIFAWGAVAYELSCGVPPFGDPGEDFMALAWRVVNEDPPALALDRDPELWRIIATALAKDPARRFRSGEDLLAALEDSAGGWAAPDLDVPEARHRTPAAAQPRPEKLARGRRGLIAASILAGLTALAALLVVVLTSAPSKPDLRFTTIAAGGPATATAPAPSSTRPSPAVPTDASGDLRPPGWGDFVVQVASRDKAAHTRPAVETEVANLFPAVSAELGVLDSGAYVPAMNAGYWVIYAGPFGSRAEAHAALARLSSYLPPDAHVRHLDRHCPKAPCT